MRRLTILAVLSLSLVALPGCTLRGDLTPEQIQQIQQQIDAVGVQVDAAHAALAEARSHRAALEAALADLPEGERRDKTLAAIAKADARLGDLDAWLAQAQAARATLQTHLASSGDVLDVIAAGGTAATPLIPQPWGAIVGAVVGLGVGVVRAWSNKRTAVRVVQAVEAAKDVAGGVVDFSAPDIRRKLRSMGPAGAKLVDEAQGRASGLPF